MSESYFVETHGDPLGVIHHVIAAAWGEYDIDKLMVLMNGGSQPDLIDAPDQIANVNPFRPLMTKNAAKYIPGVLAEHPDLRIGALLRPCEMRALREKRKRGEIQDDRLLTICVDCLGTYPADEYQWRAERKGSKDQLAWESLHFARQGGIAAYRFRSACQACRTPVSSGADVNIGVIGLPVRQKIMVESSRSLSPGKFSLNTADVGQDQGMLEQRDYIIARLLQRSSNTRQRLADNLDSILPRDVDALVKQFETCGDCRECFDSCPLCAADYPSRIESGLYDREQVKQWMISCAGCGMCEQACPNHLPLATIFNQIREQLIDPLEPIH